MVGLLGAHELPYLRIASAHIEALANGRAHFKRTQIELIRDHPFQHQNDHFDWQL